MRNRDKRAQRLGTVEQKRSACEQSMRDVWELAPEWWKELDTAYTEPTSEDVAYLDERRMHE